MHLPYLLIISKVLVGLGILYGHAHQISVMLTWPQISVASNIGHFKSMRSHHISLHYASITDCSNNEILFTLDDIEKYKIILMIALRLRLSLNA
jgi:hypothetical protein